MPPLRHPDIRSRRRPGAAALVALAALLGAACGGGSDGPVVASVDVEAFEMAFDPVDLVVPEGRVLITVTNVGREPHTFVIQQRGFKLTPFEPGTSDAGVVDLPEGAYFVYCDIEGHREAGMEGAIFVGDVEQPAITGAGR